MIYILPDPTTQACRKHPGEYKTNSRECTRCYAEAMMDLLMVDLRENVRRALHDQ